MKQKNYIIACGTHGSPKGNWFPWLEKKLKEKGFDVLNLDLPTTKNFYNDRKLVIDRIKDKLTPNTTVIAHSSAPVLIIKYCIENNIKIDKLVSVCGCSNWQTPFPEYNELHKPIFMKDISKFKNLCREIVCYYSDNDPYMKITDLETFANDLNAKKILMKGAGHINSEFGYMTAEFLETEL